MCDLNEVFRALANRKRRHVVACLQRHHVVSLPDLAEFVAERERGHGDGAVSAGAVRDVYFSLYHTHVPKLEASGLADYEQANDSVARTEALPVALERACEHLHGLHQPA